MTSQRIQPGADLGRVYDEANLLPAKRCLGHAGVRLSWVLNDAFEPE